MSTTPEIKITVVEEKADKSRETRLERAPITGLGDNKGNNVFHKAEAADQSAIQALINSFKLNANDLRFEIEWKPIEGKSVLFNDLNKKKSKLSLYLYWFIKDPVSSESIAIEEATVKKPAISKGTPPNALQHVEFTGKLKPKPIPKP